MPDLHGTGPDALDLWRTLTVNTMEDFPVGAVQCNRDVKVIGDGILYRVDADSYRTQHLAAWPQFYAETHDFDVDVAIQDTFNFQVQGPNSLALLESMTDTTMADVPFMYIEPLEIAGADVIALRQGMSGEVGFELQGDMADAERVCAAIVDAGDAYGLRQLGERTPPSTTWRCPSRRGVITTCRRSLARRFVITGSASMQGTGRRRSSPSRGAIRPTT